MCFFLRLFSFALSISNIKSAPTIASDLVELEPINPATVKIIVLLLNVNYFLLLFVHLILTPQGKIILGINI